ncbi:MAG TPA: SRPBCC family protein [Burkholderiaceae bacterium]|nr:SRPBCC family protein [Burkholderiaceae bacterium]
MRWIKITLAAVVLLVVGVLALGYALPSQYRVERSIVIDAPVARIYPLVSAPRMWLRWSIWTHRDPGMKIEYFGPDSGTGAGWRWDSRSEGRGEMTLTRTDPDTGFDYKLYFPDYQSTSTGEFRMTPEGNGTRVTWNNHGDVGSNPLHHYLAAFMDRLVGPDFDAGLHNLKALAEKP